MPQDGKGGTTTQRNLTLDCYSRYYFFVGFLFVFDSKR
jgi:hypothetical protein